MRLRYSRVINGSSDTIYLNNGGFPRGTIALDDHTLVRWSQPCHGVWHFCGASMPCMEGVVVSVDRQGRLVLPRHLREGLVDLPGRVVVRRTPEGLVLTPDRDSGTVRTSDDGLPVLELDLAVSNAEVLAAIDQERASR